MREVVGEKEGVEKERTNEDLEGMNVHNKSKMSQVSH